MGNLTRGFGVSKKKKRSSSYWVACYSKDDEDVPFSVTKKVIDYVPGQDVIKLLLLCCREFLLTTPEAWEVIVHQGPNETPDSGDQVVARLCREPFDQSEPLHI
jgi:hypothetical protein